ncbi:MAG: lamin tail domain-containing protein, partial [Akkermansiaceae bacterium]|nr:lamin tail domain-containing protein [Akkermansiaceae bacterium]
MRDIWVDGADAPLEVEWLDASRWEATVPLGPGENSLVFLARDHRGRPVGSDSITVSNTGSVVAASGANLAIAELMYHPAEGEGIEFLELVNTSTSETIDLTGVRFEEGIDYSFADRTQLAPGDRVVIGQSQFAGGSRLADGGERLTLVDGGGSLIFDF